MLLISFLILILKGKYIRTFVLSQRLSDLDICQNHLGGLLRNLDMRSLTDPWMESDALLEARTHLYNHTHHVITGVF